LHDAAFDLGLISFDDGLQLILSSRTKRKLSQRAVSDNFGVYEGEPLCLAEDAVLPDPAFLSEHRAKVFRK